MKIISIRRLIMLSFVTGGNGIPRSASQLVTVLKTYGLNTGFIEKKTLNAQSKRVRNTCEKVSWCNGHGPPAPRFPRTQ